MTAETNQAEEGQGSQLNEQQEDAKDREVQSDESLTAKLANGFASEEHPHSDVESATLERVVVYSRGSDGQQWQNFDEATLASTELGEPTTAAQSIEAAINHEPILGKETVSLIAAEENANEELMKGEEVIVENVDLINQPNRENNATDLGSVVTADASGVKPSTAIQTNGDGETVLGKITSSDLEKEATWTKPTDNVIELSTEEKESDISKTFKSIPATDADFFRNTNMKPEDGEMMQVVYGRDPPLDKAAIPGKRVWSANNANEMPDPQLDWEGRKSSGNIRYVLNEPIENTAKLTPKENQTDETKDEKMKRLINAEGELKNCLNDLKYIVVMWESSFVAVNLDEIDKVKTNSKIEKGPWPETITEEMEQSTLMRRIDSNTFYY